MICFKFITHLSYLVALGWQSGIQHLQSFRDLIQIKSPSCSFFHNAPEQDVLCLKKVRQLRTLCA